MIVFNYAEQSKNDFNRGRQDGIEDVLGFLEDLAIKYAVDKEEEKYKIATEIWNKIASKFPAE